MEAIMRIDFPTTELYFVFAFTYCKLTIYAEQEGFARKILEEKRVEFLEPSDSNTWQVWDTRLLLAIVSQTLPDLLSKSLPQPKEVSKMFAEVVGISR